jgi:DNA-binding CsgD family transcriptional regulator
MRTLARSGELEEKRSMKQGASRSASQAGILLLNSHFRPVHYNAEAVNILGYPKRAREVRDAPSLDPVLTEMQLMNLNKTATPLVPAVFEFTSGRRRYMCRAFHLDANGTVDGRVQPRIVLILERDVRRDSRPVADTTRWAEEFQLTNRECETVKLLLTGLTSKEIAVKMSISPNTVKAFLKLAMAKVGASNRTALIARLFDMASLITLVVRSDDFGWF